MSLRNSGALILIVVSLMIVFMYVQPAFSTISEVQDEIFLFKDTADKVTQINNELRLLNDQINNISQSDMRALENYVPDSIDVLQVMFDLETIANTAGVQIVGLSAPEIEDSNSNSSQRGATDELELSLAQKHTTNLDFSFKAESSYEELKALLDLLYINNYPLEVVGMDITSPDELNNQFSYELNLRTYAFNYSNNQ